MYIKSKIDENLILIMFQLKNRLYIPVIDYLLMTYVGTLLLRNSSINACTRQLYDSTMNIHLHTSKYSFINIYMMCPGVVHLYSIETQFIVFITISRSFYTE